VQGTSRQKCDAGGQRLIQSIEDSIARFEQWRPEITDTRRVTLLDRLLEPDRAATSGSADIAWNTTKAMGVPYFSPADALMFSVVRVRFLLFAARRRTSIGTVLALLNKTLFPHIGH
jgi:hypothetical protein